MAMDALLSLTMFQHDFSSVNHNYSISQTQLDSIEQWLMDAPCNLFSFAHVPLIKQINNTHGWGNGFSNYDVYISLLEQHNVHISFAGHRHFYKHDLINEFRLCYSRQLWFLFN